VLCIAIPNAREDESFADASNTLGFTDGLTMTAATVITLSALEGSGIVPAGKLTLSAQTGVYITDDMSGAASSKALVINADSDSTGSSGTLTVATGKTVTSTKSDVTITAWDLDLAGTAALTAGTATLSIHGAEAGCR
jgi:hypothetical protein